MSRSLVGKEIGDVVSQRWSGTPDRDEEKGRQQAQA